MRALTLAAILCLQLAMPVFGQHNRNSYPTPPTPAQRTIENSTTTSTRASRAADPVQLQREAREMLELSQSVQLDVDSVAHGLLPKDLSDKLKRIEKIAKHLRGEVESH